MEGKERRVARGFRVNQGRRGSVGPAQVGLPGVTAGRIGQREHEPAAPEPHMAVRVAPEVPANARAASVRRVAQPTQEAAQGQMARARDIAARVGQARERAIAGPAAQARERAIAGRAARARARDIAAPGHQARALAIAGPAARARAIAARAVQARDIAAPGHQARERAIAGRAARARALGTGVPVADPLLAAPGPSGTAKLAAEALVQLADRSRSRAALAMLAAASRLTGDGTDRGHAATGLRPHGASSRLSALKLVAKTSPTPALYRARWAGRLRRAGISGHARHGRHARSLPVVVKKASGEPAVARRVHRVPGDPLVVVGRQLVATTDPRPRRCGEAPPVPLPSTAVVVSPRARLGGARQRNGASSEVTRSKVARQFESSWPRASGRCTKFG
jgi:hypothetical protein